MYNNNISKTHQYSPVNKKIEYIKVLSVKNLYYNIQNEIEAIQILSKLRKDVICN